MACWGRKTEKKMVGQSESRSLGRDCWGRKTEKKVVGQSESRSPGGGTVVGGRLKKEGGRTE